MQTTQRSNRRRSRHRNFMWPKLFIGAVALVALLALATVGYLYGNNQYCVDLTMNGDEKIILEYGATYDEPGVRAEGYGTHIKKEHQPLEVLIDNQLDATKVGSYAIVYSATYEDAQATATRMVEVVDTKAPEITLTSDPEHFTFPNQPYQEEGFAASDNYDGDITAQVTAVEEGGKVIYTVADSSGNQTTVEREIRYDDPVAPELTLLGKTKITITEGDKWKEPGYTASDNVDGDLTEQVSVSGKVDANKPGTYKLTYEVKDGYQNAVKVERTVTVKAKPVPVPTLPPAGQTGTTGNTGTSGNTGSGSTTTEGSGKVIYLTFDDGPSKHTPRLLDILAKHNVKATFFVCNTGRLDLLDDIASQGHTLALHSKTHKYEQIYASEAAFYEDLYAIQNIVEKYSGVKSMIMRFPGGSSNGVSKKICPGIMTKLTQSVQEKGFAYFDWNVDSKDAGGAKSASEVAQNVINGSTKSSRKSLVVLQHDIKGFSVDAVDEIIQWGLANGCTFKALTSSSPTCHHGVNN